MAIKDLTHTKTRHFTTLWNVRFQKFTDQQHGYSSLHGQFTDQQHGYSSLHGQFTDQQHGYSSLHGQWLANMWADVK